MTVLCSLSYKYPCILSLFDFFTKLISPFIIEKKKPCLSNNFWYTGSSPVHCWLNHKKIWPRRLLRSQGREKVALEALASYQSSTVLCICFYVHWALNIGFHPFLPIETHLQKSFFFFLVICETRLSWCLINRFLFFGVYETKCGTREQL